MKSEKSKSNLKRKCSESMIKLEKSSKSLNSKIWINMNLTLSEKKMKVKQGLICFILKGRKIEGQSS